jgi:hypothetical protein
LHWTIPLETERSSQLRYLFGSAKPDQLDGPMFLPTLESLTTFAQIRSQPTADFAFDNIDLLSAADDWTTDDERLLLFRGY